MILQERFAYRVGDSRRMVMDAAMNWFWSRLSWDPGEPDENPEEWPINARTIELTTARIVRWNVPTLVPDYRFALVEIETPPWIDEEDLVEEPIHA